MKEKKVLQVLNSLGRGGIESFVTDLYTAIDRNTIQFDFAIAEGKSIDRLNDVQQLGAVVYYYPQLKLSNILKYIKWWVNFFGQHREYIAVHCHVYTSACIPLFIAKHFHNYTICHAHTTNNKNFNRRGYEVIIRNILLSLLRKGTYIDERFACSSDAGDWLFKNKDYSVIKNAISLDRFHFSEKKRDIYRNELGVTNNIVFGHVGNGNFAKNHMFVVRLFHEYYKNDKNARLLLIGNLKEQETVIGKYVIENDLTDCVKILGKRDDVAELMMSMDIFVFPSFFEGLGIVLIEAQATGLPCIVSESIPTEAMISDYILCESTNNEISVWIQKINLLLSRPIIREKAWENVARAGYNMADVADYMQKYYENCESGE